MRADAIIAATMRQANVGVKDFFSNSRLAHLVAARRTAIRRLKADGFDMAAIARLVDVNYSTVRYWLHKGFRARRMSINRTYWERRAANSSGPERVAA